MKITVDLSDTELDAVICLLEEKIYTERDDEEARFYEGIKNKFKNVITEELWQK